MKPHHQKAMLKYHTFDIFLTSLLTLEMLS
jgi:hypothetical protein